MPRVLYLLIITVKIVGFLGGLSPAATPVFIVSAPVALLWVDLPASPMSAWLSGNWDINPERCRLFLLILSLPHWFLGHS